MAKIDRIRQELSLHPFGGGSMRVSFDDRTHIFRDGVETTQMGLRKGDKVYVDTLTDQGRVLAKNIRVQATMQTADARGQVVGLRNGRMEIREQLTAEPVRFEVAPDTVIHLRDGAGSVADLRPGALVEVRFAPASPDRWIAREVRVLAAPGARFVFAGKVTHIDMRTGTLALLNAADQRSHEVAFDAGNPAYRRVQTGAEVTVEAEFDGARYRAQSLHIDTAP